MKNRKLFHKLLKFASFAQKPFTRGAQFQRHLPAVFLGKHNFKALPAIANKSFRDRWPDLAPKVQNPTFRVAIFSGCAQDFIYPEELEACIKILAAKNVAVDFPMEQSCCGLPLGNDGPAQNLHGRGKAEHRRDSVAATTTTSSRCAQAAPVTSSTTIPKFWTRISLRWKRRPLLPRLSTSAPLCMTCLVSSPKTSTSLAKVTYHASCHLCRGLGVKKAPRELIGDAAVHCPARKKKCAAALAAATR